MSAIAIKSRRSTISEALDTRGSTVFDIDKDELFDIVSKDKDELTRADFDKLHSVISEQAKQEAEQKNKASQQAAQASRRVKLLAVLAVVLTIFLGLSLVGNMVITQMVVDKEVTTTTTASGLLTSKVSDAEVQVAQSGQEVMLGMLPFLPMYAPFEAMAAMPEMVVLFDKASPTPSGNAKAYQTLSIKDVKYLPPFTLELHATNGGNITLAGPAVGIYTRPDGSRLDFCASCAPIMLKSLVRSKALQDSRSAFNAALATVLENMGTNNIAHPCDSDPQVTTIMHVRHVDMQRFYGMPDQCAAGASTKLADAANAIIADHRRKLQYSGSWEDTTYTGTYSRDLGGGWSASVSASHDFSDGSTSGSVGVKKSC